MKLPNGFGSCYRLSGKRRNPWVAKKFIRWEVDDENRKTRPVYRVIGYFPKKSDALKALTLANVNPQQQETITFADVYSLWSERHFSDVTLTTKSTYRNAYLYLLPLHNREMRSINTYDIERTVEDMNPPRTVVRNIKSLLMQMYKYAIAHEICEKDYSQLVDLKTDSQARIVRKVFTAEDIAKLSGDVYKDMMLVGCYTGMRPSEICELTRDEVDFEAGVLRIAGSKTKAGKNRVVPIHSNILSTLQANCLKSANFDKPAVFLNQRNEQVKYQRYKEQVYKLDHTPHDTRHTFITRAMLSGIDEYAVKLIVGHSVSDLTKRVYTHTTEEWLKEQMNLLVIC